jgi:hypothetical protein
MYLVGQTPLLKTSQLFPYSMEMELSLLSSGYRYLFHHFGNNVVNHAY